MRREGGEETELKILTRGVPEQIMIEGDRPSESTAGVYTEVPSTLATDPRPGRASEPHFRVNAPAANCYRRLPMAPHVSRPPGFRGLMSEDSEEPSKALGNNILTTPKVAPGHPGPRVGRRSVVFREFSIFRLRWTRAGNNQLWLHF